tara:strand:+ start:3151 stop:3366 length:216 start_codon:yes stop_codon:yes gene_type:complete
MRRVVNETGVSARHPEVGEWDDRAVLRIVDVGSEWERKRVTEIRFSCGDTYDTSVVGIETRRNPIASVDIE